MPCTHRRMSLTTTGSFSSPGSIGTPMYLSRSDVSRPAVASSAVVISPVVISVFSRGRGGSRVEPCIDDPPELLVAHLRVARRHGYLTVGEEEDLLGNLVRSQSFSKEA